jgi:hypothetical protein
MHQVRFSKEEDNVSLVSSLSGSISRIDNDNARNESVVSVLERKDILTLARKKSP